jgi:hypothetical protein
MEIKEHEPINIAVYAIDMKNAYSHHHENLKSYIYRYAHSFDESPY